MRRSLICKILCVLSICLSGPVRAVEAQCNAQYGGKTVTLTAKPVDDPYRFVTDDGLAPFRVSVQYLSERGKLKMYAYHDAKER